MTQNQLLKAIEKYNELYTCIIYENKISITIKDNDYFNINLDDFNADYIDDVIDDLIELLKVNCNDYTSNYVYTTYYFDDCTLIFTYADFDD